MLSGSSWDNCPVCNDMCLIFIFLPSLHGKFHVDFSALDVEKGKSFCILSMQEYFCHPVFVNRKLKRHLRNPVSCSNFPNFLIWIFVLGWTALTYSDTKCTTKELHSTAVFIDFWLTCLPSFHTLFISHYCLFTRNPCFILSVITDEYHVSHSRSKTVRL